ncbi:hypothetical protein GCM10007874_40300 [Labrys miyagiensis]|uniref:Transposase n=1 Tax=Labrys miyagiensis TaxID=346912 RepID=A0ABQ6CL41_9HYPH|nr:hypothetical protein GCM10007874_40300 [Labrys miyagiensis]
MQTFIVTLRRDRVEAPCIRDDPINGESYRTYVEAELVPTPMPGVVVMYNLRSHKSKAVSKNISAKQRRRAPASFFRQETGPNLLLCIPSLLHRLYHVTPLKAASTDCLQAIAASFQPWPFLMRGAADPDAQNRS